MRKLTIEIGLLSAGAEYNLFYSKIRISKQTRVGGVWELDGCAFGHIKNLSCCFVITLRLFVNGSNRPTLKSQGLHIKWNHSCLGGSMDLNYCHVSTMHLEIRMCPPFVSGSIGYYIWTQIYNWLFMYVQDGPGPRKLPPIFTCLKWPNQPSNTLWVIKVSQCHKCQQEISHFGAKRIKKILQNCKKKSKSNNCHNNITTFAC